MPKPIDSYQPAPDALDSKTILITGAAGGLGGAVAKQAARLGADLVLLDHNQNKLNQLHDEIESDLGRQPGLYPLDMRGASETTISNSQTLLKSPSTACTVSFIALPL